MTLRLTDLNDFIEPSQQCILQPTSTKPKENQNALEHVNIVMKADQVASSAPQTISLNDCLACSGCITSAESVLITMQSHDEFLRVIERNKNLFESGQLEKVQRFCVTLSSQTLASFAAKYDLALTEVALRLTTFFRRLLDPLPVHIFDAAFARDLSLMVMAQEMESSRLPLQVVRQRIEANLSSDSADLDSNSTLASSFHSSTNHLPMLASSCPGWICYAEKTQGSAILPFISTTRSPQQLMGVLVKDLFSQQILHTTSPTEKQLGQSIYHCAIMPCFDKKLEASRSDFTSDEGIRDVDCVLSSGELELLLQERGQTLLDIETADDLDAPFWNVAKTAAGKLELVGTPGTVSGGYVDYLCAHYMRKLAQMLDPAVFKVELEVRAGRNNDITEYAVLVQGRPVLRMATAYGFRNIQNVVRRLKKPIGRSGRLVKPSVKKAEGTTVIAGMKQSSLGWEDYDFIEVMACPSGCINGGGQLRLSGEVVERIGSVKAFVTAMEKSYHSPRLQRAAYDNTQLHLFLQSCYPDTKTIKSILDDARFKTTYHDVSTNEKNPLAEKW